MQKYLAAVLWAAICITPFQVVGQPSWINEDLVAYFPFNGNTNDESGNEFESVGFFVTPNTNRFGVENGALSFSEVDGSGVIVDFENESGLTLPSGGDSRTISFWYRVNTPIQSEPFRVVRMFFSGKWVSTGPNEVGGEIFSVGYTTDAGFDVDFRSQTFGRGGFYRVFDPTFFNSKWNHMVVTIENNRSRTYKNGQLVFFLVNPDIDIKINTTENDYYIGGFNGFKSFDGLLDDFRIYNRSLNREEVTELYQYESEGLVDSDRDGIYDFEEIKIGTDPTKRDTDGDRLFDGVEIEMGSNPLLRDSDFDGYDDYYEKNRTKTDPIKSDTDGDGFEDFQELENNSDPTDPESFPENLLIYPSIELNFGTREGKTYQLQYSPDLENWTDYQESFEGTGNKVTIFVSIKNTNMKYFRLNAVE